MGLRDRLSAGTARLADTAITRARDVVVNGDHAGARFLALLQMDDERPMTIESFVVMFVDAVRGDEGRELDEGDVVKAAKRRQRRLGALAALGGPTGLYLVSLYCEVAILCDVERAHRLGLSDAEIAGHLMVIWRLVPSHDRAMAAIDGAGASIGDRMAAQAHERVVRDALDDDEITKREAVLMVWRLRGVINDAPVPGSVSGRDVLLPGSRVRELKQAAEDQLGVGEAGGDAGFGEFASFRAGEAEPSD